MVRTAAQRYLREGFGDRMLDIAIKFIMLIVLLVTVYPFIHMFAVSVSLPGEVIKNKVTFYPIGFTTAAYRLVFGNQDFLRSYLNTILYTLIGVTINLVMTILTAYPLSRPKFLGKQIFLRLIVFTMLFSGGTIPAYILVMNLGLIDKIGAVVLPVAINTFNLMILRASFQSMPEELEEAAKIDGCNDLQILIKVFLPLCKTILMTIGLFYAVSHWNAFMIPFLYLNTRAKFPVQILLRSLLITGEMQDYASAISHEIVISQTIKYTTVIVSTLPIVMVYPFIQRYFTKGVLLGSIKG